MQDTCPLPSHPKSYTLPTQPTHSHLQELLLYKNLSHKHIVGYVDSQFDDRTSTLYIFLEYGGCRECTNWVRVF